MEIFLALVSCLLLILLAWNLADAFYEVAKMKGHSKRKYFWISFLLGPVGYLLVIALPDRGNTTAAVSDELPDL